VWWRERYCRDDWLWVGGLMSILEHNYVIIDGDSADKLFTQKVLIKPLVNYQKHVKILGQELTGVGWGRPVGH